jgi:hypothetical protein
VTVGYRFPAGPSLEVHFGRRYERPEWLRQKWVVGDVHGKRKGKEGE